jgi:hypothetical protein
MSSDQSGEQIVQQNIQCYNRRDLEGFLSTFSDNIELYSFGEGSPTVVGRENIRQFYKNLFEVSPRLHSTILNRIVLNNKVIDHERITGRMGSDELLEIVVIYEVNDGKIFRITAIRS